MGGAPEPKAGRPLPEDDAAAAADDEALRVLRRLELARAALAEAVAGGDDDDEEAARSLGTRVNRPVVGLRAMIKSPDASVVEEEEEAGAPRLRAETLIVRLGILAKGLGPPRPLKMSWAIDRGMVPLASRCSNRPASGLADRRSSL